MQKLLKIKETCQYLGISRRQLNHLIETKQLPYINLGLGKEVPRLAFSIDTLDRLISTGEKVKTMKKVEGYKTFICQNCEKETPCIIKVEDANSCITYDFLMANCNPKWVETKEVNQCEGCNGIYTDDQIDWGTGTDENPYSTHLCPYCNAVNSEASSVQL